MSPLIAVLSLLVVAAILVTVAVAFWIPLLKDLAETRDENLRYLTRKGWAVAIVAVFPLGALMYMRFGKGPQRYV